MIQKMGEISSLLKLDYDEAISPHILAATLANI